MRGVGILQAAFAVAVVAAARPAVAASSYADGNTLYSTCPSQKPHSADASFGMGYILGVIDRGQLEKSRRMCVPDNVKMGQAVDVVCLWLSNNPASRHYTGQSLIAKALSEAWPCPAE